MADEEEIPNPYEFDLRCRHCARILKIQEFRIEAYPTAGEQYAFLALCAEAKGWGHGTDFIDGEVKAVFVCPEHVRQSPQAMERELPRYRNHTNCSACGYDKLDVKHCRGLVSTCELGAVRNHLHRTCQRCGWTWIEGRLDDVKAKEQQSVQSLTQPGF
jgi:hypothetical protein